MKILVLLLCLSPVIADAQLKANKFIVYAGTGRYVPYDYYAHHDPSHTRSGPNDYKRIKIVYALDILYRVSRSVEMGVSVAQHGFEESYYSYQYNTQTQNAYSTYSLCGTGRFFYHNRRFFQAYANASGGLFLEYRKTMEVDVATGKATPRLINPPYKSLSLYISPVGVRVGNKYAGFAEVGLGYRGLINGGFSMCF